MHGASLSLILAHQGYDVIGYSHVGDFGTPIGKVIAEAENLNFPFIDLIKSGKEVTDDDLPTTKQLTELYLSATNRSKTDPDFMVKAVQYVSQIQQPSNVDNYYKKVWRVILRASRKGFDDVYQKLQIGEWASKFNPHFPPFSERGESFYGDIAPNIINELREKGIVEMSEDALIIKPEEDDDSPSPLMVRSREGNLLYAATDLAALKYRIEHEKADVILYITDNSQKNHFSMVFKAGRRAGWVKLNQSKDSSMVGFRKQQVEEFVPVLKHVSFGVVTGEDGQKLSSRDGTPISLSQLLDDAVEHTKKALLVTRSFLRSERSNHQTLNKQISRKEYEEGAPKEEPNRIGTQLESEDKTFDDLATSLAYDSIKYYELTNIRKHSYKFSFASMLNSRGNTSIYLLYAYARISTILKRAQTENIQIPSLSDTDQIKEEDIVELMDEERPLCIKLLRFPEAVRRAEIFLESNHLCLYLFEVAHEFHGFYEHSRVLGHTRQDIRLKICLATQEILSSGLKLLNIEALDRV
eukprot:TRINITY_DN7117_c0_g1_i1.p1 TRINITY_DN7117_c0_g1~~TRINITY_DN7117_c0_g1_i1.p1  ORF type:complete len:525 (+),score=102.06 TRINITY_DN7117_c0_g1_i1:125-1699(+)